MKRKFSKILGVGLTLSLLVSLLLTAAPALADVSQPGVSLPTAEDEISDVAEYSITFSITEELGLGDYIHVKFPDDTNIDDFDSILWVGSTVRALGDVIHATTYDGYTYVCTTAGTSAAPGSEPTWDNTTVGTSTTTDGTAVFTCATKITIAATSGIGSAAFSGKFPVAAATVDTDDLTVQFDLPATGFNATDTIGTMASVQIVLDGVVNPTTAGDYTLEVKTEEETDLVESAVYEIDPRTLGGGVHVYNDAGEQLAFLGGAAALDAAAAYYAMDDYTVTVGPGTYLLTKDITITGDDFTLNSSDGVDETEIDCNEAYGIVINSGTAGDTTIDGFTINDADIGITINGDDTVIKNCVIKDADGSGPGILIQAGGTGAKISDNVFDANTIAAIQFAGVALTDMDSLKITGNEIEGGDSDAPGILLSGGNQDIEITGNIISANEGSGIEIVGTVKIDDVLIKGNTISGNEEHGIDINADVAPTQLEISENDIVDNIKTGMDGIRINQATATAWDVTCVIIFNNISGNGSDAVQNDSDNDVNAFLNWWGSAVEDDFDGEIEEGGDGDINYEPWLTAEFGTGATAGDVKTNVSSIDGKDDVGVSVTGMVDDAATPVNAELIGVAKYAVNPGDDIDDAIAFYDVLVVLETGIALDEVSARLKFYDSAITEGSVASFWTGDFWAECSEQLARDGIVWVTVDEDTIPTFEDLEGTPFAVVAGEAVDVLDAPVLLAPEVGDDEVSLTPTFAWGAVDDADGYYFQFADNANFVLPLAKLDGDFGRLVTTAYAYVTELPYSTAYYWKVKAVSGLEAEGDLEESAWASGVFITKAEPEEVTPPVVVEEAPPVIIEPIVEVITPAATTTMITPAWIYVIIGVGAVLVIALLVLIVRTRRVA